MDEPENGLLSSRREFMLAAAALWQAAVLRAQEHHHAAGPAQPAVPYQFSFFNEDERKTVRLLMSRIVPADERSTGALGAKVDEYIDFVLFHADLKIQNTWKRGLHSFGSSMRGKSDADVDLVLEGQAENEFAPTTDDESFFVILKAAVTEGFYTSEIGINQELRYKGMAFLLDFPGCTHASHHAPSDWRPVLKQSNNA